MIDCRASDSEPLPMAGAQGPCRAIRGRPLFAYMRSVKNCSGSKIDHLLGEGRIDIKRTNFDDFMDVMKRLLRDSPMPASKFAASVKRFSNTYGIRDQSFVKRGMLNLTYASDLFIGDVRLVGGDICYVHNPAIAAARDVEFMKKKYLKMPIWRVDFLKSLFELSELTKKLSKE